LPPRLFAFFRTAAGGCLAGTLLASAVPVPAAAADEPPPLRRPSPAELAPLVRVALGIIEYTRWPGPLRPLTLCIAAGGAWGTHLAMAAAGVEGPRVLQPRLLPVNEPLPADCDAIVVGGWQEPVLRAAVAELAARPVLTIGAGPRFCDGGGQFCLLPGEPTSRFSVNVEALARSGLVVNPRMLQLARPRPGEPRP